MVNDLPRRIQTSHQQGRCLACRASPEPPPPPPPAGRGDDGETFLSDPVPINWTDAALEVLDREMALASATRQTFLSDRVTGAGPPRVKGLQGSKGSKGSRISIVILAIDEAKC